MKILMINSVCGIKSTGRICTDLATKLEELGHTVKIAYGRENVPEQFQKYAIRIGNDTDVKLHGIKARMFDKSGFGSEKTTKNFIEWVKQYNPDIIHLHNIHGYYINVEVLFNYLKNEFKGKIIWTLHDCWTFTGHCAYFDYANCSKWISGCHNCPSSRDYPVSYIDNSKKNWDKKKQIFAGINNLTIITPSKWLAELVKESYLSEYPVQVINNGIDTDIFKPTVSNIKYKYNIADKKIILGVSAIWDRRKGLDYLVKLSKMLDEQYQIVVIGISKEQKNNLPKNIIGILHTSSVKELAEWYSAADIFFNPTLEDNYPTTNLEAISCGTPCVTFNAGGSPESAEMYGAVVEKGDLKSVCDNIKQNDFINKKCDFTIEKMIEKYVDIYME